MLSAPSASKQSGPTRFRPASHRSDPFFAFAMVPSDELPYKVTGCSLHFRHACCVPGDLIIATHPIAGRSCNLARSSPKQGGKVERKPRLPFVLIAALGALPAAALLRYGIEAPPLTVFVVGGVALAVLAEWMRRATEQVALHAGPAIGGLLNVSFGSAAELILALFIIRSGHLDVVKAQITGSIIGTSLLGVGVACVAGGIGRSRQSFSRQRAGLQSSLLMIVVVALLMPAVVDRAEAFRAADAVLRRTTEQSLSIAVACVLLLLYGGNLVFTLVTHRDLFTRHASDVEQERARWSLPLSLGILVAATAAIAGCADIVSGALEAAASLLHLPLIFAGVVPLALIGTAADLFAAIGFARQNQMGLAMRICLGSSIQMGLVVAPLLVLISWVMGRQLTLVFPSILDLFAIGSAAFITKSIAADGETNWFEGLMLTGAYILLAIGFFFVAPA